MPNPSLNVSFLLLGLLLTGCPQGGPSTPPTPTPASKSAPANPPASPATETPAPPPAKRRSYGSIVQGGVRLEIRAALAVWTPGKGLVLSLLPFEPSAAQVEGIRRGSTTSLVLPQDPPLEGFPDRTPVATFSLAWLFGKPAEGLEKATASLNVNWLEKRNGNLSKSFPATQDRVLLEGSLKPGAAIRLRCKGDDEACSWDIDFRGALLSPLPE